MKPSDPFLNCAASIAVGTRPSPKPLLALLSLCVAFGAHATAAPTTAYPQPQPSSQEQYLLELINAARANPAAEGQMLANVTDPEILRYYQYYKVSTSQLISDFNGYAAKPPLAFNSLLNASSREQSLYMASAGVQTHNSADGTTFDQRITAEGYQWSGVGENIYAYAENPYFGHVGLMADWGVPSLDHRANVMNDNPTYPTFREIGISCVPSSIESFGPLVITEDFGTPRDGTVAYLTGVVYQDSNGSGGYDESEGFADVTVTPDSGGYYAVTSAAGGFVIPLPATGSGTLTVTASGGALGGPRTKTVAYTAGTNVKVDFTTADPVGPALPVVTISAPVKEASPNGQTALFSIARSGSTSQTLNVALSFAGTAVIGVDTNPIPSQATIPVGQASVELPVQSLNNQPSTVKKLKVLLAPNAGYSITPVVKQAKAHVLILGEN